ncbi:uncharacterized protein [Clytia hemisphaerica]|uniref:Chitin-binding type-4 domain-containing protein n=1 Tax=Clytia hemisphaerica TaxID=252671 RepID=A0A7M6DQA4_9CNID
MILKLLIVTFCFVYTIHCHGYMENPPSRNSMWRYGFPNPKNYGDNELFCGGAFVMKKNGGKCGVCGDPYHAKVQPHADGGKYANGIITRTYKQGQVIDVKIYLTMSHLGYFEFRIGEFDNKKTSGNAIGKLNGHLMDLVGGGTRFTVPRYGKQKFDIKLKLPAGLKCKRCVLQWWYKGANNWDCDKNGCGMGHGTQEHFVNCADVSIV